MSEVAARIRAVGVASTVLATDFGQVDNPAPADGMQAYLEALVNEGFAPEDIRTMASVNARGLLDI
jgi:hypothetical protein